MAGHPSRALRAFFVCVEHLQGVAMMPWALPFVLYSLKICSVSALECSSVNVDLICRTNEKF